MSREESYKGLAFFVAGAAVGAGLGLLFAPKSGKETREDIADWLKQRREKGAELLGRLREEIPAKKDQLQAALKAGKEAYYEAGRTNARKEPVHA